MQSAAEKICNAVNLQYMLIYSNLNYQNPKTYEQRANYTILYYSNFYSAESPYESEALRAGNS